MPSSARATPDTSTRHEILGHALELFGTGGYEKTSLRDIADRMGFTKAALYYHYRSKDDLLVDLFEPVMTEGDDILARHPRLRSVGQREAFLTEYFEFLWRHRLLLCHVACDLAVLSTPETGGRVIGHVSSVVDALAGGSANEATRTRAKATLGALQGPITLVDPDSDFTVTRKVAVASALAALSAT